MATYRVRQNVDTYRPARWAGTDYERRFGARNEGFTLDAPSLDAARAMLRSGAAGERLNPALLSIEPEPGSEPEQLDLTGRAVPIPPAPPAAPPAPSEPGPEPLQLSMDLDVTLAVRLPRGLGIAHQPPLSVGGS